MKQFDAIIVGGGLIGASAACEAAKAGSRVLLVDKHSVGTGASGNSAAMLELQIDAHRGEPFYSLAKASHDLFPSLAAELMASTGIDTGYEPCAIMQVAMTPEEAVVLEEECQRQTRMGLRARWLTSTQVGNHVPDLTQSIFGAALFHEDGNINGNLLLKALVAGAEMHGAQVIFSQTDSRLVIENGRVVGVQYGDQLALAPKIVIAAGAWLDPVLEPLGIHTGVTPVRGQLVVFETPTRILPFPIYTKSGGYLTPKREGITLAGTTVENAGFDTRSTDEGRESILRLVRQLYPKLLRYPIRTVTAGLRPKSPDDLPLLGPLPDHPNVFVASGHYRNGVLLAPISGRIAAAFVRDAHAPLSIEPFALTRLLTQR